MKGLISSYSEKTESEAHQKNERNLHRHILFMATHRKLPAEKKMLFCPQLRHLQDI